MSLIRHRNYLCSLIPFGLVEGYSRRMVPKYVYAKGFNVGGIDINILRSKEVILVRDAMKKFAELVPLSPNLITNQEIPQKKKKYIIQIARIFIASTVLDHIEWVRGASQQQWHQQHQLHQNQFRICSVN